MSVDDKLTNHEQRISSLEADIGDFKIELAQITVKLDASEARAFDRFNVLSTAQVEVKDILKARDDEAREYRRQRERQEYEANKDRQKWVRSLISPQTIMILFAVLLSMLGMRAADIQAMSELIGAPLPGAPHENP